MRALRILKEATAIAAEDTRRTRQLLAAFELHTPLFSLHEHNEKSRIPYVLQRLRDGETIALVTDAGMPGIADPGMHLVHACIEEGIPVVPVPGPTAATTALVASGLCTDGFVFVGFPPVHKRKRDDLFQRLTSYPETLVFYEGPHRLPQTLRHMQQYWGDRRAALGRELTKLHEQFVRGTVDELVQWCNVGPLRGEFVIVVAGQATESMLSPPTPKQLEEALKKALVAGKSRRDATDYVASVYNAPRRLVYEIANRLPDDD